MIHYIKTEQDYFRSVQDGRKKFELRKNDRDFKVKQSTTKRFTVERLRCTLSRH